MSEALERLSLIEDESTFLNWANAGFAPNYNFKVSDIQEVVSLAKANKQTSVDGMRLEIAMDMCLAFLMNPNTTVEDVILSAKAHVAYADALIAELQKQK